MDSRHLLQMFSKTFKNLITSPHCQRQSPSNVIPRIIPKLAPTRQRRHFNSTSPLLQNNDSLNTTLSNILRESVPQTTQTPPKRSLPRQALRPLQRLPDLDLTISTGDGFNNMRDVIPPLPAGHNRPPELGPNVGRSVAFKAGDVTQGMNRLRRVLVENNVRTDARIQRFHERAGMKRKRLKRDRFRKRFKEGFKKMVGIVLDMKRQGL